jgi:hypothetical protein
MVLIVDMGSPPTTLEASPGARHTLETERLECVLVARVPFHATEV